MESQLSFFQIEAETNILVADIRTEQQLSKQVAYDVGEKIGNSRKDLAALRKAFESKHSTHALNELEEVSAVVAAELIHKQELFKGFSLENEKEIGTEPAVARVKQLLIQRVNAYPRTDSREGRAAFMKASQHFMKRLETVRVWDDLRSFISEYSKTIMYEKCNPDTFRTKIELYKNIMNHNDTDSREWKQADIYRASSIESLDATLEAKELCLVSLGDKFCSFFRKNSSCQSTLENAMKIQSWDELLEKKEKKKGTARKASWERTLPERPDRMGGAQSIVEKPEDLLNFFHFRGVEFGHYVEDAKGKEHLLRSSEAMMDLAEIIGVDYTSISLQGTLAMAYGARGRGGNALAHFEPLSNVINMTKEKGCLGVFAHEWFHALDCFLFDLSHEFKNGRKGFLSENESIGSNVSPQLVKAFKELVESTKEGNAISYIENNNRSGVRWSGESFKSAYKRYNGDLFKAMEAKVAEENKKLANHLQLFSHYAFSDKERNNLQKRHDRDIKRFALALAWYHEAVTGEYVEQIPYPSGESEYYRASILLDKGKKGKYWSSPVEMTARAFESFIQDKLKAAGRKSDYLVAGTRDGVAFPMGEEREKINKKFDEIVGFIRELSLAHGGTGK